MNGFLRAVWSPLPQAGWNFVAFTPKWSRKQVPMLYPSKIKEEFAANDPRPGPVSNATLFSTIITKFNPIDCAEKQLHVQSNNTQMARFVVATSQQVSSHLFGKHLLPASLFVGLKTAPSHRLTVWGQMRLGVIETLFSVELSAHSLWHNKKGDFAC